MNSVLERLFSSLSKKTELLRPIVPIEKWIHDSYYVGKDGLKLYPFWRDHIIDIFKGGQRYNEVIITGSLGCRPVDSVYNTSVGLKKLSDIAVGSYILSPTGLAKVVGNHNVGVQDTVRVVFSNGEDMEATTDHRIRCLTTSGIVWKRFDELTVDDNVLYCRLPTPYDGDRYDYDKSYLMGYIYGDGYVTCDRNRENSIVGVMYQPGFNYLRDLALRYIGGVERRCRNLMHVRAVNRDLISEWEGIGHADDKKIPSWYFLKSSRDKSEFLSGLFDSDGYIGTDTIELTLNSPFLIRQVRELLREFGIVAHVNWCNGQKRNRLHIQGFQNWVRLNSTLNLRIDYKKKALKELVSKQYSRNQRTILYGLRDYIHTNRITENWKFRRVDSSYRHMRYGKQNITLELLNKFKKDYPSYQDDVIDFLVRNDCEIIHPISFEYSRCECGDIEVEGHEYINSGFINHNTGKSTAGLYILLRKLYEISCYANVAEMFNLMSTAYTVFVYFSLSKFQAERTGYAQFRSMVDQIPYFTENFPRKDSLQSKLMFPENVMFIHGTQSSDTIGLNVLATILDEANFFQTSSQPDKDIYQKVTDLHESIITRNASRFVRGSVNSSLSVLISSSTYKSSFTERRIAAASNSSNVKVIHGRLWDVKPKGTYSDKNFYVFVGNDKYDPFVIDSADLLIKNLGVTIKSTDISEAVKELPHELASLVDLVPIDFYSIYSNNVIRGLQDISGYSIAPQGKLFSAHNLFQESLIDNYALFTKYQFVISTQDESESNSVQYYLSGIEFQHKECPRYIHIDQSCHFDPTGFGCVHKYGTKFVDGQELPIFHLDFGLRIMPPPEPKRISIARVRQFLYYMRDVLKLNIAYVTYDQFASAEARQQLEEDGFNVGYLSVDRTAEQYLFYTQLFYQGRIRIPRENANLIEKELFDLNYYRSRNKVDHPTTNTKDLSDGIVGALWNAQTHRDVRVNLDDCRNFSSYTLGSSGYYDESDIDIRRISAEDADNYGLDK